MTRPAARPGERVLFAGGAGSIEAVVDSPPERARGTALIAHPHPLFGGTLDNKVVQTLAKTFVELGWLVVRPNFRGVGARDNERENQLAPRLDIGW